MGLTLQPSVNATVSSPRHLILSPSVSALFHRSNYKSRFNHGTSRQVCRAASNSRNGDVVSQSLKKRAVWVKTGAQAGSSHIDTASYQEFSSGYLKKTGGESLDLFLNVGLGVTGLSLFMSLAPDLWDFYQRAVETNPLEVKAAISGVVFLLGDVIAQGCTGDESSPQRDLGQALGFGLLGTVLHGPLSHLYYIGLDHICLQQSLLDQSSPFLVLVKIGIDQTVWSLFWNGIHLFFSGLLKRESLEDVIHSIGSSWIDLLRAGWRVWPLVHVFTYGVVPLQHRLLFVDGVDLVWVAILSAYSQQQRNSVRNETLNILEATIPHVDTSLPKEELV